MATTPVPVTRSAATTASPPDLWRSLRTEMDRMFERMTGGALTAPFGGMWDFQFPSTRPDEFPRVTMPAVDLTEDDKAFKLTVEMPGLTEKDVNVSVSGDVLTVSGEKRQEREEKDKNWHLTERSYGEFRRSFVLPPSIDREGIEAGCKDGVLTVTMNKKAEAKPQTIEVKATA